MKTPTDLAALNAAVDAKFASVNPAVALAYRAGRYWWPEMSALLEQREDVFVEVQLRAGVDPAMLADRARVDTIARRIFIHG